MNKGNALINRYTIEALAVRPLDRILEIGMGNGFFVKEILAVDPSVTYVGCDFSEAMVEAAMQINEPFVQSGSARFLLADAQHLPLEDASFNKVFTINTIYFWEKPEKVFAELRRVLDPGGQLLVAIRPREVMEQLPMVKYGFQTFTPDALATIVVAHGFRVSHLIEKSEPVQDFMGESVRMGTVIAVAVKKD